MNVILHIEFEEGFEIFTELIQNISNHVLNQKHFIITPKVSWENGNLDHNETYLWQYTRESKSAIQKNLKENINNVLKKNQQITNKMNDQIEFGKNILCQP